MEYIEAIVALILGSILICIVISASFKDGYKKGQLDAIKGKQQYKLIEFPDGTREYRKNPKPEDFNKENQDFKIIKQ